MVPRNRARVYNGTALDRNFFASLSHDQLAQHIFPDSFEASDKREIIAHFVSEIFRLFGLRVTHNITDSKWYPGTTPGGDLSQTRPVPSYYYKQQICDLYCSDCRECRDSQVHFDGQADKKYHGEVHVVATLEFTAVEKNAKKEIVRFGGSVCSLYHHHVHNDGSDLKQLLGGGWCVMNVPKFVGDTYAAAVDHCKQVLHPGRGRHTAKVNELLVIDRPSEKPEDNRYYLTMSGETDAWDVRVATASCNDDDDVDSTLVNLTRHRRAVVTLFYLICNRLGLQEIVSPFVYKMLNYRVQHSNATPNPNFRLFCCEESLLAGGFSRGNLVEDQKWHVDHADAEPFKGQLVGSYPPTADDLSELLKVGMSFIHPISEEGRLVHILKSSFHLTGEQCLLFLGNVAHAGATHSLKNQATNKSIWPALHVHIDTIGEKRTVGYLTFYEKGNTHLDCGELESRPRKRRARS